MCCIRFIYYINVYLNFIELHGKFIVYFILIKFSFILYEQYNIIIGNIIKHVLLGLPEYTVDVCVLLVYYIIILFNIFQFNNRNSSYTGIIENGVIEIDKRNEVFDAPQQTGKRNKIIGIIYVIHTYILVINTIFIIFFFD